MVNQSLVESTNVELGGNGDLLGHGGIESEWRKKLEGGQDEFKVWDEGGVEIVAGNDEDEVLLIRGIHFRSAVDYIQFYQVKLIFGYLIMTQSRNTMNDN